MITRWFLLFAATFINPILPAPSQDPWVVYENGLYYYAESSGNAIAIRTASRLTDIGKHSQTLVWQAPREGPCSREIWAPELHRVDGSWFIYFAADDGKNEHHRMWVAESRTKGPLGPYGEASMLNTDGWAIDGTTFLHEGKRYFVWSGWPGDTDGQQNLYIARMAGPRRLETPRVKLCEPAEQWERRALPLCEGPAALQKGNRLLLVYSASASWTADYCLGALNFRGGSILDPGSWEKIGPVFSRTDSVFGVGHCSFVPSPDGTESWIVYHAKEKAADGWDDRSARAQRFEWTADGLPNFGRPAARHERLNIPSEDCR